ncbi:MAG TPA: hypothetical protein DDZ51_04235 [Planctomycetaceae bacterium]|nr:hypothetical protein [Planctomycetaceae bacterium]
MEGDQYGRRNPSVAVDQSGHRGNPNGLGFGSQISWQNIDGRTVAMSFCTIVKDTVLFRMPQGGFARVPLKHLSESSRAVALQLHKSSIYEHLTEIGPNATPLVWGGTGGGKAKLRLLAVDGGAAAFEDSHHQIIITSLDKVAPESMGHLVSLCKSVLAKVQDKTFVVQQAGIDRQAVIRSELEKRRSEYLELGKTIAGYQDDELDAWFGQLVAGVSSDGVGIQWTVPVANERANTPAVKQRFEQQMTNDLFAVLELTTNQFDALRSSSTVNLKVPTATESPVDPTEPSDVVQGGSGSVVTSPVENTSGTSPSFPKSSPTLPSSVLDGGVTYIELTPIAGIGFSDACCETSCVVPSCKVQDACQPVSCGTSTHCDAYVWEAACSPCPPIRHGLLARLFGKACSK